MKFQLKCEIIHSRKCTYENIVCEMAAILFGGDELTHLMVNPKYSWIVKSISWLSMPWLLQSSGSSYGIEHIGYTVPWLSRGWISTDSTTLVLIDHRKCKYICLQKRIYVLLGLLPVITCIKLRSWNDRTHESQDAPVWHVYLQHGNQYTRGPFTNMV